MVAPTLYQRIKIREAGYNPDYWWPIEWTDERVILKDRATQAVVRLNNIEVWGSGVCRNLDDEG